MAEQNKIVNFLITLSRFHRELEVGDNQNQVTTEAGNASKQNKGRGCFQNYSSKSLFILMTVLAVLMIIVAILIVILLVRITPVNGTIMPKFDQEDAQANNTTQNPYASIYYVPTTINADPAINNSPPARLRIMSRLDWGAQPPVEEATKLSTPVPYVIISHTATDNCSSQAQCVLHVRYIQTFHMESRGWYDIGYNFLVGGDGAAYVGRGWTSEGAHTYGYNKKSIGIAFIGSFARYLPPSRQLLACQQLIAKGVELGYISKDYKLLASRQVQTTESPGRALYEELKKWPHWTSALNWGM